MGGRVQVFGRPVGSAMGSVAQVDGVVFYGRAQKTFQLGDRILVIVSATGNCEDNEIISQVPLVAVAMQGVSHSFSFSVTASGNQRQIEVCRPFSESFQPI